MSLISFFGGKPAAKPLMTPGNIVLATTTLFEWAPTSQLTLMKSMRINKGGSVKVYMDFYVDVGLPSVRWSLIRDGATVASGNYSSGSLLQGWKYETVASVTIPSTGGNLELWASKGYAPGAGTSYIAVNTFRISGAYLDTGFATITNP